MRSLCLACLALGLQNVIWALPLEAPHHAAGWPTLEGRTLRENLPVTPTRTLNYTDVRQQATDPLTTHAPELDKREGTDWGVWLINPLARELRLTHIFHSDPGQFS